MNIYEEENTTSRLTRRKSADARDIPAPNFSVCGFHVGADSSSRFSQAVILCRVELGLGEGEC